MAPYLQCRKRKRPNTISEPADRYACTSSDGTDTSKPTAVYVPTKGRSHTLSIALPGSVIANAQSHDLKSSLAGTIARAAAVFGVDEIVIFDDGQGQALGRGRGSSAYGSSPNSPRDGCWKPHERVLYGGFGAMEDADRGGYTGYSDPGFFLYHLLSYLETPPNLRKALFPLHPNLRTAGTLPSLDMPHHLRADEWCQYREGVVLDPAASDDGSSSSASSSPTLAVRKPSHIISLKKQKRFKKGIPPLASAVSRQASDSPPGALNLGANARAELSADSGSTHVLVDAGLPQPVRLVNVGIQQQQQQKPIAPHTRVTLKLAGAPPHDRWHGVQTAHAVDPALPREEAGFYWGYRTRRAGSLSAVFTECPFVGGYDVAIGTSERGMPLSHVLARGSGGGAGIGRGRCVGAAPLPSRFEHLLLVFGGIAGLEAAAAADRNLAARGVTARNVGDMFDAWVNLVPGQGSRTIRCEEAVWLGLMAFHGYAQRNGES